MKEIRVLFVTIFVLFFSTCTTNETPVSGNSISEPITSLKQKIFAGDKDAYKKLKTMYLDHSPEDSLFWSLYMWNRYEHPEAALDVFRSITSAYINGDLDKFSTIDSTTQKLLYDYLNHAVEGGVLEAEELISEISKF